MKQSATRCSAYPSTPSHRRSGGLLSCSTALPLVLLIAHSIALAADDAPQVIPIGPAYAANSVNASILRVNSLATHGQFQFVTYYDPDGKIVVGRRKTSDTNWDLATLETIGHVADAHNDVVLGISGDGILHLSYDHHGGPLHYRISSKPDDIRSFGPERPMTGVTEEHVTYPEFISAPDGSLYFFYRDGASGNGSLCLDRYDPKDGSWKALAHPLIDGEGKCNPYWWRPDIGVDGSIHIAWCWRDSPDASTNHDLCYARSVDGGKTWLRSDGKPQVVPITRGNAEVVLPIAKKSNLINQCTLAVDAQGHPHLAQYFNDDSGTVQYFHVWFDGAKWIKNQVSKRTEKFSIGGGGTLAIPISRPEIAIGKSGTVYIITRENSIGGIHMYRSAAPFEKWVESDLSREDFGDWEPSYDISRWMADGVLSLFALPVRQGNHEKVTGTAPQEARLIEISLP